MTHTFPQWLAGLAGAGGAPSFFRKALAASPELQQRVTDYFQPYAERGFTFTPLGEGGRGLVVGLTPPGGTEADTFAFKLDMAAPNVRLSADGVEPKPLPDVFSGGPAQHLAYRTLKPVVTDAAAPLSTGEILAVTAFPVQRFVHFGIRGGLHAGDYPLPQAMEMVGAVHAVQRVNEASGLPDLDNQVLDIALTPGGGVARQADTGWMVMAPPVDRLYERDVSGSPVHAYSSRTGREQMVFADAVRAHEQSRLILVTEGWVHIPVIPGEVMTLGMLREARVLNVGPEALLLAMQVAASGAAADYPVAGLPPIPAGYINREAAEGWMIRADEFGNPKGFVVHDGPLVRPAADKDGNWLRAGRGIADMHIERAEHAIEHPVYFLKGGEQRAAYLAAPAAERAAILRAGLENLLADERHRAHTDAPVPDTFWGRLYGAQLEAMDAGYPSVYAHRSALGLSTAIRERPQQEAAEPALPPAASSPEAHPPGEAQPQAGGRLGWLKRALGGRGGGNNGNERAPG